MRGLLVLVLLALATLPALARVPAPAEHGRVAALDRASHDHDSHAHDSHAHDSHAHDSHAHDSHDHDSHDHDSHDHDSHDHDSHDHDSHGADAAPTWHGDDGGAPASGHRDVHPALACCVAMHCPMLTGHLPGAPVQPSPPAGSPRSEAAMPRRLAGLSIPPALPPPRAVA